MRYFSSLIAMSIWFIWSMPVNAENPIQLYYYDRAPYAITDTQGEVSGLCATPAANAFKQAGIPFQWKKMPFKRQLATLKHNKKMACGIGWFKKPERESFARFTNSIYQDKPAVTISKKDNNALGRHRDLISLFKDKKVKLLVKDGFSYGAYVDDLINDYDPAIVSVVTSTNVQMLQMILSGRADYFFISEEEADHIILSAGYETSQFQLKHFADMPAGNRRYIACSQQVSPEIVDLLNRALTRTSRN
jgi:polar amino acid transport system substrate-binding protein